MRGRGHRKKSSRANEPEEKEHTTKNKGDEAKRGKKKKPKNQRFAYDLYCQQLLNSNQAVPSSHRSIDRAHENAYKQGTKILQSQTTYARHGTSNSMTRREHILR